MTDTKQRPVIYCGSVSGHAVVTIEMKYQYDLDDLHDLNFCGEAGDSPEDLEDQLKAELDRVLSNEIENTLDRLGYHRGEPEIIAATDCHILDKEISDLEIEMEDVKEEETA